MTIELAKGDLNPENQFGKAKDEAQAKRWPVTTRPNGWAKYPFAYSPVDERSKVLLPDWQKIQWIEIAFQHLEDGHSLRETAEWLSMKTGKSLTYNGLSNLWKRQKGRKQTPRTKRLRERKKAIKEKLTPEEKAQRRINIAAGGEKRRITNAVKRLDHLRDRTEKLKGTTTAILEAPTVPERRSIIEGLINPPDPETTEIIFQPNPGPQTDFLAASETEVLYGGSGGSGKSYAMLADPMRYFGNKNFVGILLRRTNDELRELIWKSRELYPKAFPGAKWSEKKSQWEFPSGARIWFTYLERDEDVLRYQGQAFCVGEGTPVRMSDGSFKPIEQVQAGEHVETLEGAKEVLYRSATQRKKCVRVSSYSLDGHLLSSQIQPANHPIALLSSATLQRSSDWYRTAYKLRSAPLQWLSPETLQSLPQESLENCVYQEDGRNGYVGSAPHNQDNLPLHGSFYLGVLHGPSLQSALSRASTQFDGEKDCTPLRIRYLSEWYSHPYTVEQRRLECPAELGIVHVEPIDEPFQNVHDITISDVAHYITYGGIVNRNCWIGFDELTQYPTPFAFNYMRSRLRTTDPDLPLCVRCTTNPGGPGHSWVKRTFIDPAPYNRPFPATDIETGRVLRYPDTHSTKPGQPLFYRRFIPARLYDNPYLANDGAYEANLLSLPEMQRRQLLEGDWTVTEGAAFSEFRVSNHTCAPFDIPPDWTRFRSCDFGYTTHSCVHWFAVDPEFNTIYLYRELYVSKHTAKALALKVIELEAAEPVLYGVLDSSCWHNRGHTGPSIAEEMIREGCKWRQADRTAGSRVAGKNRLHELLKVDPEIEKPGLIIFNTCRQIIADLPVIPVDPKGSDDIDQRYASDHAYDSLRYGIMSRPRSWLEEFRQRNTATYTPSDPVFGY